MPSAAASLLADGLPGSIVADESLVNLDRATATAHGRQIAGAHSLAQPVCHKPCGFVRYLQRPMELMGADALLAGRHQERGLEPLMERNMAGLEHGSDLGREILATRLAAAQAGPRSLAL